MTFLKQLYLDWLYWRLRAQRERLDHLRRDYHDMMQHCAERIDMLEERILEVE